MKKIGMVTSYFLVFTFFVCFATPGISNAGWQPWTATFFNCNNGEAIELTGMEMVQIVDRWDAAGGQHYRLTDIVRATGIGLTTGSGYIFSARFPVEMTNILYQGGAYEDTFLLNGVLLAQDRNVSDLRVHITIHFTFDANGNLASDHYFEDVTCTEP